MVVNNYEANAPLNLKVSIEERNGFKSCLSLRGKTCKDILRQAIVKCIADTDNFLSYIFE
jgi:hypothetical protein